MDFYFDFLSPFAYLMHHRLPSIAQQHGYRIVYRAIDLPMTKRAAGNSGPANREIPSKFRYLMTDLSRWAQRYGIPLQLPPSLDSARLNKGSFYAMQKGAADVYVDRAWRATWSVGGDMSSDQLLSTIALEMGWNVSEFIDFTSSDEAERLYEREGREAHDNGVFGVPTVRIGEHLWWGNDRLDFLAEHLREAASKT